MALRPSSLPMLQACPQFEAGDAGDDANAGALRHQYLAHLLEGHEQKLAGAFSIQLSEQDVESVQWAADYIRTKSPTSDWPLLVEQKVNPVDEFGTPYFPNGGTFDAACGPEMFDFKWRYRDYKAQCAAYALGYFQYHRKFWNEKNAGTDETKWFSTIKFHVLYGEQKKAYSYEFTEDSARAIVESVVNSVTPEAEPNPCDYCNWCSKMLTCKAYLEKVNIIAQHREDTAKEDAIALCEWIQKGAHT